MLDWAGFPVEHRGRLKGRGKDQEPALKDVDTRVGDVVGGSVAGFFSQMVSTVKGLLRRNAAGQWAVDNAVREVMWMGFLKQARKRNEKRLKDFQRGCVDVLVFSEQEVAEFERDPCGLLFQDNTCWV